MSAPDTFCRIRFTEGGFNVSVPITVATGRAPAQDVLPAKEWSINDDVLSLSDTCAVTIANIDGENSGKIQVGQRVEVELSNKDVRNGTWIRAFTGVVTETHHTSDSSGSIISVTMQDNGWYLTSCDAKPLVNIKNLKFAELLRRLLDPSWGISEIRADNDLSRRIKHGRQMIIQNFKPILGAVLPFIQVEPGQKPADIILQYAAREGVLVNVAADGALVFFRPDYSQEALYSAVYSSGIDDTSDNNVVGKPDLRDSIDGYFSELQCWSTVVLDPAVTGPKDAENPNAGLRHTIYRPKVNPLPFERRLVFSDAEAIDKALRMQRAIWKQQMAQFQAWEYDVQFDRHSQNGAFFVSDSMISVDDRVNKVKGVFFVQSVTRSQTVGEGTRTRMKIRKPVLDPTLTALQFGGTKGPAKTKRRGKNPSVDAIFAAADARRGRR